MACTLQLHRLVTREEAETLQSYLERSVEGSQAAVGRQRLKVQRLGATLAGKVDEVIGVRSMIESLQRRLRVVQALGALQARNDYVRQMQEEAIDAAFWDLSAAYERLNLAEILHELVFWDVEVERHRLRVLERAVYRLELEVHVVCMVLEAELPKLQCQQGVVSNFLDTSGFQGQLTCSPKLFLLPLICRTI
jgi:hypothetical protein